MKCRQLFLASLLAAILSVISAPAADTPKAMPYPRNTCIVSGEKPGGMGTPLVLEYKGQEIKLSCNSCSAKFEEDPDTWLKKVWEGGKKH